MTTDQRLPARGGQDMITIKRTSENDARLIIAAPELLAELRRFVEYYAQGGRVNALGTGEAFQHWDRSRRLLARLDADGSEMVNHV